MTDPAAPSQDPADLDSLLGTLRLVLRKALAATDDMLPAKVLAYDRATNRVSVQPLVRVVATNGQRVARAQIASLPVLRMGGGGFVLSFPLQTGDLGWIKASDRDISLFLQSYSEADPNTARLHSFADAVFIPDVMTGWSVEGVDESRAVLQSTDGTVRVALGSSVLALTAPTVTIDAPTVGITGATTITGNLDVIGAVTSTVNFSVGAITLTTHLHPENGGVGPTDPPIPGP